MSGSSLSFAVGGNGHGCLMAIRSGWLFPRMVFHIVRGTAKCAASAYMPDCRFRQLQCRAWASATTETLRPGWGTTARTLIVETLRSSYGRETLVIGWHCSPPLTLASIGTSEMCFLYQWRVIVHLVHRKPLCVLSWFRLTRVYRLLQV